MKKKSSSRSADARALIALVLFLAAGCLVASGTLPASFRPEAAEEISGRTLTFAERFAYQRAIEEVYWRHRIWPKENRDPKPSLDEVMSQQQIDKKVEDYLRKSQALEDYWQRPITAEQLQAEMDRMASHSKQPEVLRELFDALGNDRFVIAECLARPILAERLVSESHHQDAVTSGRGDSPESPGYAWVSIAGSGRLKSVAPTIGNFATRSMSMETQWNNAAYKLPEISVPITCVDDSWIATGTTNAPSSRDQQTVLWTGSEMIVWGGVFYDGSAFHFLDTGGRYNPSTDTWTATSTANAPSGRYRHTAIWTGSEMIIWGGYNNATPFSTGGRYNPATNSWTATNTINAPAPRFWHTAVWNGNEMIVWAGGSDTAGYLNTGGRYNPGTNSWTATSTTNVPVGRINPTAVWTGSEMIVWGGYNNTSIDLHTGGRYNPGTNSWTAISTTNAPLGREFHKAIWTGSEMIVWGGYNHFALVLNTGGRYNPGTDSWESTCTINAPSARYRHTAVWTGNEMIIWGGAPVDANYLNTGGRYNPGTDRWVATSTNTAPTGRYDHTAVWTGSEMIVWGGFDISFVEDNSGGRYCAQTAPTAQTAFSRKIHGAAGTFDIPLPFACNPGIECRSGGASNDYQIIVNFVTTVTVGSASITTGTGTVSSFTVSGSEVTVNLTGVSNVQRITVTLFNVNDGTHMGNVAVSMGVLVGDVNGNGRVNASDVALSKSRIGQTVGPTTFRSDVIADGSIGASDVSLVKSLVGTGLP